jgi:hypothetical protein
MARKAKQRRPIHPLDMIDALKTLNDALGIYLAQVENASQLIAEGVVAGDQMQKLGRDLQQDTETLRATLWPDPDD